MSTFICHKSYGRAGDICDYLLPQYLRHNIEALTDDSVGTVISIPRNVEFF